AVNYYYRHRNFWYMRHHSKERREMNYYSGVMVDKDKAKEVKLLGLGDTFEEKYKNVFARYFAGIRKLIVREGFMQIAVGFISVLCNCALFAYVAYNIVFNDGQIGDYGLYTGALTSIASSITTLVSSTATIYEGTLFIDNMMTFMKEKTTIVPLEGEGIHPAVGAPHVLELRDVCFRYPGSDKDVIRNVNLTLRSGERVVLVGLNGAGKTTLIKLITRLYDPTSGVILLDGKDIREYAPDEYHKLFGIIFQDFGKYAVSVRENIEFGDIDRDHMDEEVRAAAVHGNADAFIGNLPVGYETPLTRMFEENGIELSGGQWQKLAISRAFYKKSDVLILDEPTAALDPLAEQEVYDQFTDLAQGKISIFVSHRLSGAVTANKIVVLEAGTVAEIGTHAELMDKQGKYFVLFSTQASRYTGIDYDAEADRRDDELGREHHKRLTREELMDQM
ncbi:MAG: ABC transporter ATP-binding protein/permease, partial [Clostridia bacterium]|nr:ABC transporter ATP-binding protein/permease [Clostridia bacterium]